MSENVEANVEATPPNEEAAEKNQVAEQSAEQKAAQAAAGPVDPATVKPSEEAIKAAKDDAKFRAENPNVPVARDAREGVGGENFAYLENN